MINTKKYFAKNRAGLGRPRKSDYRHAGWIILLVAVATVLLCWLIGRVYDYRHTQEKAFLDYLAPLRDNAGFLSPVATSSSTFQERHDTTISIIDRYLAKKKSPMAGLGKWLYEIPKIYGIDNPYLMVSVAMVESSGGKHLPTNSFNPYGWFSGKFNFSSFIEATEVVCHKIATLPYYKRFRKDQSIGSFSLAYNAPYAQSYADKLDFFINEFKKEELQ